MLHVNEDFPGFWRAREYDHYFKGTIRDILGIYLREQGILPVLKGTLTKILQNNVI